MTMQWEHGALPGWASDLDRALTVQSQFVVSGNIRDVYPVNSGDGPGFKPVLDVVWDVLSARGYEFLLVYDPVDNLRLAISDQINAAKAAGRPQQADGLQGELARQLAAASGVPGLRLDNAGARSVSLDVLPELIRALTRTQSAAGAIVIDYASRLSARPQELSEDQHAFFVACEKAAHQTRQLRALNGTAPPFNPVIWLVNRPNDLPIWFTAGNETIRALIAGLPDRETRSRVAGQMADHFPDSAQLTEPRRQELVDQFTLHTEGMTVRSLLAIRELARDPRFGLERIVDAIRAYKVGVPDDPWKQPSVRRRIREGDQIIGQRVKGQKPAIDKSLDILKRSVMGLTGAQANRTGGRPRGVLFFAGPTGVGKTELAKAITLLLFGDESAYHRFDMSEFSSEHSEARLIGAPPGYVGHDAGGELVNAVRQRPFSVLLFDEIDKAHWRILDKFLQILEDGRLTDGQGETVFFSECVIVFTSNLGIAEEGEKGLRVPIVSESDDYSVIDERVKEEIRHHFRSKLGRPELLNRIGDNIVVFDFIRPAVASQIFSKMLANTLERVTTEHGLSLTLTDKVRLKVEALCLEKLDDGGRGIGNRLESFFINPLARALFARSETLSDALTITDLVEREGEWKLVVQ